MPQSPTSQQLFENIVVDNGLITPAQLNRAKSALDKKRGKGQRKLALGDLLVDLGLISEQQFESVRAAQYYRETRNEDKRLGRQLVRMKLANPVTIQELLEEQKVHYSNKGATISLVHMLVDQNILTRDQLRHANQELDHRDAVRSKRIAQQQGGSIYVVCPACGTKLAIKTHNVGKTVKCSKCGIRFKTLTSPESPESGKAVDKDVIEINKRDLRGAEKAALLSSVSSADNSLGDLPDSANLDSDPDLDLVADDELSSLDDIDLDPNALTSDSDSDGLDIDDLDLDELSSEDLESDEDESFGVIDELDSVSDFEDDLEIEDDLEDVGDSDDLELRSEDIDDLDLESDIETVDQDQPNKTQSDALKIASDIDFDNLDLLDDEDTGPEIEDSDEDYEISNITSEDELQVAELASDFELNETPTAEKSEADAEDDEEALILRSDSVPEDGESSDSTDLDESASAEEVESLSDFEAVIANKFQNDQGVAEIFPAADVPALDGTAALFGAGGVEDDSGVHEANEATGAILPESEILPSLTSSGIYDAAWAANAFDDRPYSSRSDESFRTAKRKSQADLKPREEELQVVEPIIPLAKTTAPSSKPLPPALGQRPNIQSQQMSVIEHEIQLIQDLGPLLDDIPDEPGLNEFLREHVSPKGTHAGLETISLVAIDELDERHQLDELLSDSDASGLTRREYSRRFARPKFMPQAPKSPKFPLPADEVEQQPDQVSIEPKSPLLVPTLQRPDSEEVSVQPSRKLTDSELAPPIGLESETFNVNYQNDYLIPPTTAPAGAPTEKKANVPGILDFGATREGVPGSFSDEGPDPFAASEPMEAPVVESPAETLQVSDTIPAPQIEAVIEPPVIQEETPVIAEEAVEQADPVAKPKFDDEQLSRAFDTAMKAAWIVFRKELGID